MKKKMIKYLSFISAAILMVTSVNASNVTSTQDIPIGSSSSMEMIGTIEPTIMSVTMPTFVPFNISNSVTGQNKVISPRVNVINNSSIPVKIDVIYTKVDLSKMPDVSWSDTGTVNSDQIAIGFKKANDANPPTDLSQAKWLKANQSQDTNVLILNSTEAGAMYVVGTLGANVSENATFSVIPSFIVSRTS